MVTLFTSAPAASDEQLMARVRRGSPAAFEEGTFFRRRVGGRGAGGRSGSARIRVVPTLLFWAVLIVPAALFVRRRLRRDAPVT